MTPISPFLLLFSALTLLYSPPVLAGTVFNLTRIHHKQPSTAVHNILSAEAEKRKRRAFDAVEGFSLGGHRVTSDDDSIGVVHAVSQGGAEEADIVGGANDDGVVSMTSAVAGGTINPQDEVTLDLTSSASHGVAYTVEVNVDGTVFNVIADTGSSQFWVPTQSCASCVSAGMQSSTVQLSEPCTSWNQTYGLGSVVGCIVDVDVKLGGMDVPDYGILGVKQIDSAFTRQASFMSGIIGFGKDEGTVDGSATLLSALVEYNQIKSSTVGFYISRESSGSQLYLGDAETSSFAKGESVKLAYQDNPYGYYKVQMDSLDAGGVQLSSSASVIIDTGSTALIVPRSVAPQLAVALLGTEGVYYLLNGMYILPCVQQAGQTADLTITLGGKAFTVTYESLIGPALTSEWCEAWIMSASSDIWVLGDAFLKNVYSIYDTKSGQVTLYPL